MTNGTERDFAFLYRTEQGVVDAPTWRRAAWPLAAIFAALTTLWLVVQPYAGRSLSARALFDPLAIGANLYLIVYTLAVLLLGVCWVNLTAKRFRDLGRAPPVGFASVVPLLVLLDGALHWLHPRVTDTLPRWSVLCGDAIVLITLAWTVAECLDLLRNGR